MVGDNLWLWRADHDVNGLVSDSANRCDHALVVDGDDVTMYGLAAEHVLGEFRSSSEAHDETSRHTPATSRARARK